MVYSSVNDLFESDFWHVRMWHDNHSGIIKIKAWKCNLPYLTFKNDNHLGKVWFVIEASFLLRQAYEKDVYRPSSLRERERSRPPLSNVFETEEKRREIQKEIERAQQLLADAHEVEVGEVPSKPDEEFTEGEELEKVCCHFFVVTCDRFDSYKPFITYQWFGHFMTFISNKCLQSIVCDIDDICNFC